MGVSVRRCQERRWIFVADAEKTKTAQTSNKVSNVARKVDGRYKRLKGAKCFTDVPCTVQRVVGPFQASGRVHPGRSAICVIQRQASRAVSQTMVAGEPPSNARREALATLLAAGLFRAGHSRRSNGQ